MSDLEKLDWRLAEIADLEARLQAGRSGLQQLARDLLRDPALSDVARRQRAARLYWHYPDVQARAIAVGLFGAGAHIHTLRAILPLYPSDLTCTTCGAPLAFDSRKALNEARLAAARRKAKKGYHGWLLRCDHCDQEERASRSPPLTRPEDAMPDARQRVTRLQVLRAMPYADYLQTPEWKATAQRARIAAGYRCQVCNVADELHVHHRTYVRRGAERDADLIVLCKTCHSLFHANGKLKGP